MSAGRANNVTSIGQVKKGMILAAGEGTRLRPLTDDRPKPMLPIAGRPALEYTLVWLRHYGVCQVGINLHHCPRVVMDYFGDGSALGVEIVYSLEETILGTAGGVKRLAGFFDAPLVLVYGDVLTDLNLAALIEFHLRQPPVPHLSMSLYHVANPGDCGIVSLDERGRVTRFAEKAKAGEVISDLANAGVLVLDRGILDCVPEGRFYDFGLHLFPRLLHLGVPMYGWHLPDTAYLIDFGTPEKYEQVQREWPTSQAKTFMEQREK